MLSAVCFMPNIPSFQHSNIPSLSPGFWFLIPLLSPQFAIPARHLPAMLRNARQAGREPQF
jgi:hypothetical protein